MDASTIGTPHRRRLRQIWRSAGWPRHDEVELALLAAALPFTVWMALARATPRAIDDDAQGHLGDPGGVSAQWLG